MQFSMSNLEYLSLLLLLCPPVGSFAQPEMWRPDIAQDIPTHWPGTSA